MGSPTPSGRRTFISQAAMSVAAARLGIFGDSAVRGGGPGELTAVARGTTWLNSPPLTAAALHRRIVLVNFCTYTCINWIRTLPYLRAWSKAYQNQIVVVGVHTPEFGFEHDTGNVRRALDRLGVPYPIALDNDYRIWRTFRNNYWPALYLIDAKGRLRNHQFGEGDYDRWEMLMQRMIAEAGGGGLRSSAPIARASGIEAAADWGNLRTPETYVGYERMENFASRGRVDRDRRRLYAAPARLAPNQWALTGEWTVGRQGALLNSPGGGIAFSFHARDLHLVMGSASGAAPVRFRVTTKRHHTRSAQGADVDEGGNGIASEPRLYQLVRQPKPVSDELFEIEFLDPGIEVFAFTFG